MKLIRKIKRAWFPEKLSYVEIMEEVKEEFMKGGEEYTKPPTYICCHVNGILRRSTDNKAEYIVDIIDKQIDYLASVENFIEYRHKDIYAQIENYSDSRFAWFHWQIRISLIEALIEYFKTGEKYEIYFDHDSISYQCRSTSESTATACCSGH